MGACTKDITMGKVRLRRCFNYYKLAMWIHSRVAKSTRSEAPDANPNVPSDIVRDYDEASSIPDLSPTGATGADPAIKSATVQVTWPARKESQ